MQARSRNHCLRGKASTYFYVCVCRVGVGVRTRECAFARVSLLIQDATRMRTIVISASLVPPYSSTLSHKLHDFREK